MYGDDAYVCEQLVLLKVERSELEPVSFSVANPTPKPLHHQVAHNPYIAPSPKINIADLCLTYLVLT